MYSVNHVRTIPTGTYTPMREVHSMTYKRMFTEYMASQIRQDRQHGMKIDELSWKYHCSQPTISMVIAHRGAYARTYRQRERYDRTRK